MRSEVEVTIIKVLGFR